MEAERGFHQALIEAHGRSCYPIELAPGIYKDPGPYTEIMSYWDGGVCSTPIGKQKQRWDEFRQFQLRVRGYFLRHSTFPELQQRVTDRRRRHGLDGDVRLLEDRDKQSDLDHWMEYQDYELQTGERFEMNLEKAKAILITRRDAVAEAGLTVYEEVQDLDFGGYFALSNSHRDEESPAWKRWFQAERKLELAESRLKAADSDDLGDLVKKETWVRWFQKQINAAQRQLDTIPKYRREDWQPQGKYYVQEGKNENENMEKTRAAQSKRHYAEGKAEDALRLAKEGLEAAQADGFREEIERATLPTMALTEDQSAREQFEEETKKKDQVLLKGKVIGALGWIVQANINIGQHQVLLKWIEQQRHEMTNSCASIEGTDQSKRNSSKPLRARRKTGKPRLKGSTIANHRKTTPSKKTSILKPNHAFKVIKSTSKKQNLQQRARISCSPPQPSNMTTAVPNTVSPKKMEAPKFKIEVSSLRSVRSSRISKPNRRKLPGKSKIGTRSQKKADLIPPSSSSTRRRTSQRSVDMTLRRSARVSRRPERFRPA